MGRSKAVREREECKECESCVASCPLFFQVADEELADLKGSGRLGGNDKNDKLDTDDPGCGMPMLDGCSLYTSSKTAIESSKVRIIQ